MPRYTYKKQPELLKELLKNYTIPEIKKLVGLVASNLPTRKAELVTVIRRYLENPENLGKMGRFNMVPIDNEKAFCRVLLELG